MKIPDVGFPLGTHPTIYEFYEWTRSVVNDGRYQLRVINSPPDWTTNDGEMLAVNDANTSQKSLWMFVTDAWYSVPLSLAGNGGPVPVGGIVPFCGPETALPSGWALCNGAAASRTTYAALFGVIGIAFGSGDGSTTFNLPDLRGRFPLGADNMGGVSAGRVNDAAAQTIGQGDGNESNLGPDFNVTGTAPIQLRSSGMNPYQTINYIIKL